MRSKGWTSDTERGSGRQMLREENGDVRVGGGGVKVMLDAGKRKSGMSFDFLKNLL